MVVYLRIEQVMAAHDRVLEAHGGLAGVRDLGRLEAAVAMPRGTFSGQFLHPSPQAMAAAYRFHITQAHAFIDGNKPTAVTCAFSFLLGNGLNIQASEDELFDLTVAIADHRRSKEEVTAFFESRIAARE
mgnify:CR=1 FL=1